LKRRSDDILAGVNLRHTSATDTLCRVIFARTILQRDKIAVQRRFVNAARLVCSGAGCMLGLMSVRQSVCLSHRSTAATAALLL